MAEINEKGLDLSEEDFETPGENLDENGEDKTDWKDAANKGYGIANRYRTKFGKLKEAFNEYKTTHPDKPKDETKPEEADQPQDKKVLDLAEKTYLITKGIKEEQFGLVLEELNKSKLSVDELLKSSYFMEKVEKAQTASATPDGSEKGGGSARTEEDYWINKGEYPPDTPENKELRRKVAARLAKNSSEKTHFSSRPIV